MSDLTSDQPTPGVAERVADIRAAGAVLGLVSTALDQIDWDQLAADISRAEALGPILVPTEFRAGIDRLDINRRAVDATRNYLAVLRDLAPKREASTDG